VEYIARHIAGVQQVRICPFFLWTSSEWAFFQSYTQSGGVRPFGIATLIAGFDPQDPTPRLYCTDPSGIHNAWKVILSFYPVLPVLNV
jgi:20S proteasome subunit alpha 4